MRRLLLPFGVLLCISAFAMTEEQPLLLRQPTMNRTHIVFAYAGDLWSAPRGGGEAVRLTVGWDPLESTCRHASLSIL